ncbi:hypothetical protein [Heyndrickxia coagulans]|uniref:hypothetical protein n=1 Tax=Heyndrickxia coagulans TaxID=1398 RepID=UPI001A93D299|nr:hypothetical protein [Heyndrickxia coagulans]
MPQTYQQYLKEHHEQHLKELFDFLQIPSVSSLSEHQTDVRKVFFARKKCRVLQYINSFIPHKNSI